MFKQAPNKNYIFKHFISKDSIDSEIEILVIMVELSVPTFEVSVPNEILLSEINLDQNIYL